MVLSRCLIAHSTLLGCFWLLGQIAHGQLPDNFLKKYCYDCHSTGNIEAGLDLNTLGVGITEENARRWEQVLDRISAGEMPPRDSLQPPPQDRAIAIESIKRLILGWDSKTAQSTPTLRRLTRSEYENTIRDLLDMPGLALANYLPADGQSHGFDKHAEALDISHVNIAKYLEVADRILDDAIATRPEPPTIHHRRISLVNRGGFVAHIVMNGDGVLLKDGNLDPTFPPAGEQNHLDQGAHERFGSFNNGASVGLFRHEDESVSPYFIEHVTIYPARYRIRTSLWGFQWDQGKILPGRGTEAARLSVVQLTGDGRGGQHPSYVLGYFNAPNNKPLEHELVVWMNRNEIIGFNAASLAPAANYYKKKRALEFTGPGIVVDWLDVEGPLYEAWPPTSHRVLFGDLPIALFPAKEPGHARPPSRYRPPQLGAGMNRPDPEPGLWTVQSESPLQDAERLLSSFLPRLFRKPVPRDVTADYLAIVNQRIELGDCFEDAMRTAFRSALVSPDFLFHIEDAPDERTEFSLASRLSYFLWNSLPDERLSELASQGELAQPATLHREVERMLADPRSNRFINDFIGQWLKLNQIGATDPDKKLYPEFSPYLQDAMVAETRAYFQELIDRDLNASHLLKSEFVMVNEKLAVHYGIPGVFGTQFRRVQLPEGCPRGGFLTQASILKITSNGTTTSPVPRGAFVMDRLLGEPPSPPPANVAAIEPDVRGTTSIREQLAKHRHEPQCASCHQKIDPPGFALEAFDVIGGFRTRYRSIGEGEPAERGAIDPMIGIGFKIGPAVDSSGQWIDGRSFENIRDYQNLIAVNSTKILANLTRQLAVYATGKTLRFSDRPAIDAIVKRTEEQGGGVRTLLHELIASPLFIGKKIAPTPASEANAWRDLWRSSMIQRAASDADSQRFLLATPVEPVQSPAQRAPSIESTVNPMTDYLFDPEHEVQLRVLGLFSSERIPAFEEIMKRFPEVKLTAVDFETAVASIKFASQCDLFRNANTAQIVERMNNQIRQLSAGLFSVRPVGDTDRSSLKQVSFTIVGLDCQACSLAVQDILESTEGVIHATASFRNRLATAWIDPNKTTRANLEAKLVQRGVTLAPGTD